MLTRVTMNRVTSSKLLRRWPVGVGLALLVQLSCLSAGCAHAPVHVVPLLDTAGIPITSTPARSIPLEVVTRSTAIADPMPVEGSDVAYVDVESALGHATSSATAEWAAHSTVKRDGGYRLFIELVAARARFADGRLIVSFDVRVTLHARVGGDFVAQTRAHCQEGALAPAELGAPVVYRCMSQVGRDLSAWLGRLDL